MSAELLRRAAAVMRADAETEKVLREGDPYYAPEGLEQSEYDRRMTPVVALAVADLLEETQSHYVNEYGDGCVLCSPGESGWPCSTVTEAFAVARAYLGEKS